MKRLMVLSMPTDISAPRFAEEGKEVGVEVILMNYTDLHMQSLPLAQIERAEDMGLILRSPYRVNNLNDNFFGLIRIMLETYRFGNVLDEKLYMSDYMAMNDKLMKQAVMEKSGVEVAPLVNPLIHDWTFPIIAKLRHGSRSKGNYVLFGEKDWQIFNYKNNLGDYVFQRYYLLAGDYRILVLGRKVLGVLERRIHIKAGNRIVVKGLRQVCLPSKLEKQSILMAELIGADLLGVDVGKRQDGSYFFIEYNFSPQFLGFERETGIDVAGMVIEYLMGLAK